VTDPPLIPASLYGLRTWGLAEDAEGEWLTAVAHGTRWPPGGAWLEAACGVGAAHEAPQDDCTCGVHGWHPRRTSARTVLAGRFEVPGIVEAAGAIEVHEEGFRAARARPYALVLLPGRNAGRVARLAERYRAQVVEVPDADALLDWSRERGLGLDERVVDDLLGADVVAERRQARRRRARTDALRIVAAVVASVVLWALGTHFITDPSGPRDVVGRAGEFHVP
jgi:hypothetical protein